jgi:hypothetical protein
LVTLAVVVPVAALVLLAIGALTGYLAFNRHNLNSTATGVARAASVAAVETQTAQAELVTPVASLTPLPAPLPTLAPGEIARLFNDAQLLTVLIDDNQLVEAPAGQDLLIEVNHRGDDANAYIYLYPGTRLQLGSVTGESAQVALLEGSRVFVQSGPFPDGVEIELAGLPVITTLRGCLGAEYVGGAGETTLTAFCFQGACSLSADFGATSDDIPAGQKVTLELPRLEAGPLRPITQADARPFSNLLQLTSPGRADALQCHVLLPGPNATPEREPQTPPRGTPGGAPPTAPP